MKSNLFLILFVLTSCILFSQKRELNCLNFYKGEFRNISDDTGLVSIIIRSGEKQLEIINDVKSYKRIQWLNDCDYVLYFPKKEARKDSFKKFINDNGGISVKALRTEDKTLYYKTSFFDGKKENVSGGKLMKISSKASFK